MASRDVAQVMSCSLMESRSTSLFLPQADGFASCENRIKITFHAQGYTAKQRVDEGHVGFIIHGQSRTTWL
jgi:hypothetical protein